MLAAVMVGGKPKVRCLQALIKNKFPQYLIEVYFHHAVLRIFHISTGIFYKCCQKICQKDVLKLNNQVTREFSRQTIAKTKSKILETQEYLEGLIVKVKTRVKTFERFVVTKASKINLVEDIFCGHDEVIFFPWKIKLG